MPLTTAQQQLISAKLDANLTAVSTARLVELCLLYRANPTLSHSFPAALDAEIARRFDAAALDSDEVNFSVLKNFANQFQSPIPFFYAKLQEMAASVNRDIWFSNNEMLFKDNINDGEVMTWLLTQSDILEKCLNNQYGLAWLAQSEVASTAILTDGAATDLWKESTNLWQIWPQYAAGMQVLAKSSTLVQYVIEYPMALAAVTASEVAMTAVVASETALTVVVASEIAMTAIATSEIAMAVLAASETAMATVVDSEIAITAVTESETALAAVVLSSAAKKVLVAHNTVLQSSRERIYETIKTSWVKKGEQQSDGVSQANALANAHNGLVFATLGYFSSNTTARTTMLHAGGTVAATAGSTSNPSKLGSIDGVSFKGCTFTEKGDGYVAIEVWAPQ